MQTALLVIHIVLAIVMIAVVLVQKSEGGALGMGGSSGGFMTTRGTANLLTRTTAILAACFFLSTLGLALAFKGGQKTRSVLDVEDAAPQAAPLVPGAPVAPTNVAPVMPAETAPVTTPPSESVKDASVPSQETQKGKKSTKKSASSKAEKDKNPS